MQVQQRVFRRSGRGRQLVENILILAADVPGTIFFDQHLLVDKHAHNLFHKERIPLCTTEYSMPQYIRNIFCSEKGINQFTALLFGKRFQCERCKIAASSPPIAAALEEVWTSRTEKKDRDIRDAIHQML